MDANPTGDSLVPGKVKSSRPHLSPTDSPELRRKKRLAAQDLDAELTVCEAKAAIVTVARWNLKNIRPNFSGVSTLLGVGTRV